MPKAKKILPLTLVLILAGCAGPSSRHHDAPLITEADSRFRSGDFVGASKIYQRLAEQSDDADYYRLLAADSELRVGNDRVASALLGAVQIDDLTEGDRQRYVLLRSRLDLNQGKAREAMALLDEVDYQKLTTPLRAHYHTLRASAYNQLGNMLECARERVYYGQIISNPEAVQKNNESIYDALNRLPYRVLADLQPSTEGTLGAWMALVLAMRAPPADRVRLVKVWRGNYPNHPANGAFVEKFLNRTPKTVEVEALKSTETPVEKPIEPVTPPPPPAPVPPVVPEPSAEPAAAPTSTAFIGVMLPLSGAYAQAGQVVRTGLTAAWNADPASGKPELRFVDTQGAEAATVYRKLVGEGAKFVIGPLLKEEVATLAAVGDFQVPVLALNQSQDTGREGLYQFALTPEQEVEQVASLAWFDGRQNALLLAPASPLGQRLANHFKSYWKSLGGKLADSKTYQPRAADYSETAKQLLAGVAEDDSAATVAKPEFILLIADSHDGRLLNPHLENQLPGRVPVYSTSMIFNGQANSPQNQDLTGVTFCDSPWLIAGDNGPLSRQALQTAVQQTPEPYLRLLPMAIDAYQLMNELTQLKNNGLGRYPGATGTLSLRSGNRVQRQLHCAQFDGGSLQPRGIAPMLQPGGGTVAP